KGYQLDAGGFCFFGYALADQAGGGNIATVDLLAGQVFAHFGLERGSADEHTIAFRRNDVRVDVQIRAVNREAMNSQLADFPTGRNCTTQTGDSLVHNSSLPARLFLLGFFDDDAFIGITHTFALVGFGFAISTNFSSHLANDLLVGALDDDLGLSGTLDLDTGRHAVNDVVRKTKLQLQCVALDLSAETHANQIQTALEAFADARYHIGNQCAHCARHGLGLA